uniref:Uncharacterized protein n=1 Tax=Leptobrachium leishanense TaxID=445787 RepID=A0A8C5QP76_9ANUR
MMVLNLLVYMWSSYFIIPVDLALQISNLRFYSVNYETLLQWDALNSSKGTFYYVQYKEYGGAWENKTDCFGIEEHHCNMTSEMSSPEHKCETMFARVRFIAGNYYSTWKRSTSFRPFHDTNITPPTVILSSTTKSISITISVPNIILQSNCVSEANKKSTHFIISMSHEYETPIIYDTTEFVWKISHLQPGSYCISVQMEMPNMMKKSIPSSIQCVGVDTAVTNHIIKGSVAVVLVTIFIISMLGVYLALYNYVLHPKTQLPSNLILRSIDSKAIVHRGDENMLIPSTVESMELTRYIQETKESSPQIMQCKRYVSNDPVRKDYINCGQKNDQSFGDQKESTVEVKNPSYATKPLDCSLDDHHSYVFVLPHQMSEEINCINKTNETLDYTSNSTNPNYTNNRSILGPYYTNTGQLHLSEGFHVFKEKPEMTKWTFNNYFNQNE